MHSNPYDILGIDEQATSEELHAAYQARRAEVIASQQPDEALEQLDKAYQEILRNVSKKMTGTGLTVIQPGGQVQSDPQKSINIFNPTNFAALTMSEQATSLPVTFIICPHCSAANPVQLTECQVCSMQVSRPCTVCTAQIPLEAQVCPRCGAAVNQVAKIRALQANEAQQQVSRERVEEEIRVRINEQRHTTRARYGLIFWTIVSLVMTGLCAMAAFAYWYANQPR